MRYFANRQTGLTPKFSFHQTSCATCSTQIIYWMSFSYYHGGIIFKMFQEVGFIPQPSQSGLYISWKTVARAPAFWSDQETKRSCEGSALSVRPACAWGSALRKGGGTQQGDVVTVSRHGYLWFITLYPDRLILCLLLAHHQTNSIGVDLVP